MVQAVGREPGDRGRGGAVNRNDGRTLRDDVLFGDLVRAAGDDDAGAVLDGRDRRRESCGGPRDVGRLDGRDPVLGDDRIVGDRDGGAGDVDVEVGVPLLVGDRRAVEDEVSGRDKNRLGGRGVGDALIGARERERRGLAGEEVYERPVRGVGGGRIDAEPLVGAGGREVGPVEGEDDGIGDDDRADRDRRVGEDDVGRDVAVAGQVQRGAVEPVLVRDREDARIVGVPAEPADVRPGGRRGRGRSRIVASGARIFVFMGWSFLPEKDGVGGVTGRILPERRGECKRFLVCNWYSLFACGTTSVPIEFPA